MFPLFVGWLSQPEVCILKPKVVPEMSLSISPRFLDPNVSRVWNGLLRIWGVGEHSNQQKSQRQRIEISYVDLILRRCDLSWIYPTTQDTIVVKGVPYSKCKNSGGDWHPGLGVDPKYNYTILGIQKKLELYKYAMCSTMHLLAELPQGFRFRSAVQLSKKIFQTAHPEKLTAFNASWNFGPQHSNPFDFQFPKPDVSSRG